LLTGFFRLEWSGILLPLAQSCLRELVLALQPLILTILVCLVTLIVFYHVFLAWVIVAFMHFDGIGIVISLIRHALLI
jgi:hypothetical protein